MSADLDPYAAAPALGEPLGGLLIGGEAKAVPLDIPGVDHTVAWSVRYEAGPHPIWSNVGRWSDGTVRVLTADQGAWAELVRDAGISIASEEVAVAYAKAYLEITRGSMVLVRPVESVDDLPWRPGSGDEEAAKAALLASPPDLAPRAERAAGGFHVELALVVDQRLQRNTFDITADGVVTASFDVLAEGLPFPIAR